MSVPQLSIIVPNYNHADFLPKCLDAILAQSFTDFEVVVVDDASTDHSMEVIQKYAARDRRIRVYQNEKNGGVIFTLNRALELSRADYVFGAAADDYVLPGYFEDVMRMFRKYPHAGIGLGLTQCIDGDGRNRTVVPGMWADEARYIAPDELVSKMTTCGVPGPVIWKKAAFLEAGGYQPELRWHGDWFPLQVVALRYGVCFLPQKTAVVREVEDSYSQNQHKSQIQRAILVRLLTMMAEPKYADVLPRVAASGILRQFGPNLIRAAATAADTLSSSLFPSLQEHVFAHAPSLLHDPDSNVRAGIPILIGRYGRNAFGLYELLDERRPDSDPRVPIAVRAARAAIRRDVPRKAFLKYRLRVGGGSFMRRLDRLLHPLHHRRMERIEMLLTEMVRFQQGETYQALSALYHQLEGVKTVLREAQATRTEERTGPKVTRAA